MSKSNTYKSRRAALRQVLGLGSLALAGCGNGGDDANDSGANSNPGTGNTSGQPSEGNSGSASVVISASPQSTTVRSGSAASFSVTANGTGILSYQWFRNAVVIPGATTSQFRTGTLTYADNGATYSVTVSDRNGTATSSGATLTVTPMVVEVAATNYASYALLEDGTMWGWGASETLGVGETKVAVGNAIKLQNADGSVFTGIRSVGCGEHNAFVIKNDGTLWGWGTNSDGQLGDGSLLRRKSPVQVVTASGAPFTGVKQVDTATEHTVALKEDGTVWTWGGNQFAQLGNGKQGNVASGLSSLYPVQVLIAEGRPLTNVIQISTLALSSAALRDDGTVWVWGYGHPPYAVQVEASQGSALKNVLAIAGDSGTHLLALSSDGSILALGSNNDGALGTGDTIDRAFPSFVVGASGNVFKDVKGVAAGFVGFSVALLNDGSVWSFGENVFGVLGIGLSTTGSKRLTPVPVQTSAGTPLRGITAVRTHFAHVIALATDGTVWTWGYNAYGQVGNGNTAMQTTAQQITSGIY